MKQWYYEVYEPDATKALGPGSSWDHADDVISLAKQAMEGGLVVRVLAPAGASTEDIDKLKALGAVVA